MMAAAEIDPFHAGQVSAELLLHRLQGGLQGIGVLLAEGVEMQTVQKL